MRICILFMSPPLSNAKRAWVAPISARRRVVLTLNSNLVRHGRSRRSLAIELRHQPDGNRANQHRHRGGIEEPARTPAGGKQEARRQGSEDTTEPPDAECPA